MINYDAPLTKLQRAILVGMVVLGMLASAAIVGTMDYDAALVTAGQVK